MKTVCTLAVLVVCALALSSFQVDAATEDDSGLVRDAGNGHLVPTLENSVDLKAKGMHRHLLLGKNYYPSPDYKKYPQHPPQPKYPDFKHPKHPTHPKHPDFKHPKHPDFKHPQHPPRPKHCKGYYCY